MIRAILLGVVVALPGAALASHMGQYSSDPLERDLQGQVHEPDGAVTSVLGPRIENCVVELPVAGAFDGRCSRAHEARGHGAIAPGCTGPDEAGRPMRRLDGQCGLWEVGAPRPNNVWTPVVGPRTGPGQVAPPIGERGMGPGAYPGRYAGPIRFLDARLDADFVQNPASGGPTYVKDYNRLLQDLAAGGMTPTPLGEPLPAIAPLAPAAGAILPGQHMVWAWYGQWDDRNGNGVVDHCYGGCHPANGAGVNEFAWLGSCTSFEGPRVPESVQAGICIEDGNPNLDPPGAPCDDPADWQACAGTTLTQWIWPGNHHGNGMLGDQPGNQLFSWVGPYVFSPTLDCSTPPDPTCDERDWGLDGDPVLGRQDEVRPDGTLHDRTGDGVNESPPDDSARQWSGYFGGDSTYYGDDGLLVTLVHITGVNCAPGDTAASFNLRTPPGHAGGCTFLDVDRHPTVSADAEVLFVGDPEHPTGGAKAMARSAWVFVRERGPSLQKLASSIADSNELYQTSAGPRRHELDDQLIDNGWSREPNVGSISFKDATGASHTLTEQYVGVQHADCEDDALFPVGDSRNPTSAHDAASDEAAHRGFCNVHVGGEPWPAYRDYATGVARGFLDLQPVRGVFTDFPFTLLGPPCTYCSWFATNVDWNHDPESTAALPAVREPSNHERTLGAGRYYFHGTVGAWVDRPFTQDESLFPDAYGTTWSVYPSPHDAFPQGDGWVGVVARSNGEFHYRGFSFGTCPLATDKDPGSARARPGVHDAAECDPYFDGQIDDPQDYTDAEYVPGGEFEGACDSSRMGPIYVAPEDGVLDTQIVAIANYGGGIGPLPELWNDPGMFAYGPGPVDPLEIPVTCFGRTAFVGTTFLYWPAGNMLDAIVTWASADIDLRPAMPSFDRITDVDYYPAYALPAEAAPPPLPL